jgi:hypothetical protein
MGVFLDVEVFGAFEGWGCLGEVSGPGGIQTYLVEF